MASAIMQAVKEETVQIVSTTGRRLLTTEATAVRALREEMTSVTRSAASQETRIVPEIHTTESVLSSIVTPSTMAADLSLSVREQISQAGGQALEGFGDVLHKTSAEAPGGVRGAAATGSVLQQVNGLSGFSSSVSAS